MSAAIHHASSYRDPSGFLFTKDGVLYRQVNRVFEEDFSQFEKCGLYRHLVDKGWLVPHEVMEENLTGDASWLRTLRPEMVPVISYPHEWSFDMLKDGALLTLQLAREAMSFGMMLKDASAYNVQMHKGKMTFIDTLSFERYNALMPWIAYRQFCEHFLAPLALMHYHQLPLHALQLAYADGIPLPVAKKLLPFKSRWHLHTYLHLHLHGKASVAPAKTGRPTPFSEAKMKNLLRSLEEAVRGYHLNAPTGVWSGYYEEALQRADYVERKKELIRQWTGELSLATVLDLGANEGTFSRLFAGRGIFTIATDFDHYSINNLYRAVKDEGLDNLLPLLLDLSLPSPAIGVNNRERSAAFDRLKADAVLALALVHHLAIGKNIPFTYIADMAAALGRYLVIEFVPKSDEKVQLMLQHKKDIYTGYTPENFVQAFGKRYRILQQAEVGSSGRTLYLMERHG